MQTAAASRDCTFCAKEGRKSAAHRVLSSGKGACELHYEQWAAGKMKPAVPAPAWQPPTADEIRAEEKERKTSQGTAERAAQEKQGVRNTMDKRKLDEGLKHRIQTQWRGNSAAQEIATSTGVNVATVYYVCKGIKRKPGKKTRLQNGREGFHPRSIGMQAGPGASSVARAALNGSGLVLRVQATADMIEQEWQRWSDALPAETKALILNQRGYKRIAMVPYHRK